MIIEHVYSRKVCISTNLTCNLKCIYCYEREKKNIELDVDEAIGVLTEILNTKTESGTKIKLHGGEPFLVYDKIKQLCETLWNKNFNDYYHFHVTTNGTLVHGEIQEWLIKNKDKITLKLSLDGDKRSNDINRPHSFDLIDLPFFLSTWPNLRVNMTITPSTIPFFASNIKYLHSVGIRNILCHFSLFTDWSKCNMKADFYNQLLDLIDYYIENPHIKPCSFFTYNIARTLDKREYCSSCNIGEMKAFDFQTKKYYPCYMCFPSVAGDKKSAELEKIDFSKCADTEKECCIKCPFINLCFTCYADNYIARGSVSNRDMNLCPYYKLVFCALFKYEYLRILRLKRPTFDDVLKMKAIQKWHHEVENITTHL